MRVLFTSLFVVGLVLAGASAVAEKKITLRADHQPFGEVLTEISEQSGIPIVLSSNSLPISAEPVQFSVKNSDVEKALDRALSGYDYTLSWHADAGQFTKVLVTVHERKEGSAEKALFSSTPRPSIDASAKPLSGRELTLYMAAEIEWRRKVGYEEPDATPEQLANAAAMEDMVHRIGRVKKK